MPLRACLDPNASNYGFNRSGEFCPNAQDHDQMACEYTSHTIDEEVMAESIGSENYTTHEEATSRAETNLTDRERNRSAYENSLKSNNSSPLLTLGILAYLFMS